LNLTLAGFYLHHRGAIGSPSPFAAAAIRYQVLHICYNADRFYAEVPACASFPAVAAVAALNALRSVCRDRIRSLCAQHGRGAVLALNATRDLEQILNPFLSLRSVSVAGTAVRQAAGECLVLKCLLVEACQTELARKKAETHPAVCWVQGAPLLPAGARLTGRHDLRMLRCSWLPGHAGIVLDAARVSRAWPCTCYTYRLTVCFWRGARSRGAVVVRADAAESRRAVRTGGRRPGFCTHDSGEHHGQAQ